MTAESHDLDAMERRMSKKLKIAAAAVAALTLTAVMAASTGQADAKGFKPGFGFGLVAGTMIGAAAASGGPGYVDYGYRRCRWVRQFDEYGFYIGRARVCAF
jgi:hypothetical protein